MSLSIPAWKRLGLKLKYAKDQPDGVNGSGVERKSTQERQMTNDYADERPHKRQRTSKTANGETNHLQDPSQIRKSSTTIETRTTSNSSRSVDDAADTSVHKTPNRRKSVTFSTDTKASDGDSRITIDFPAGSPGSTPYKAKQSRGATELDPAVAGDVSQEAPEDQLGKPKKKKKSPASKKLNGQRPDGKTKTDSALPYLVQHRHDRDSWKFNKNRDVWIVSHALDANAIPPSHVLALAGYVKGLPVNAGARQRLIQQCRDGLAEFDGSAHQNKEEQEQFLALLEDSQAKAESHVDFLNSIPRPVVLLWSLGEVVGTAKTEALAGSSAATSKSLVERGRKSRTAAPVDISSSESDSDTDSTDSDSEEEDERSGAKVSDSTGVDGAADDTSSSGTDSSSGSDSADSSDSSSEDDSD